LLNAASESVWECAPSSVKLKNDLENNNNFAGSKATWEASRQFQFIGRRY
jgi:hypothetical protein